MLILFQSRKDGWPGVNSKKREHIETQDGDSAPARAGVKAPLCSVMVGVIITKVLDAQPISAHFHKIFYTMGLLGSFQRVSSIQPIYTFSNIRRSKNTIMF